MEKATRGTDEDTSLSTVAAQQRIAGTAGLVHTTGQLGTVERLWSAMLASICGMKVGCKRNHHRTKARYQVKMERDL